jgi:hypothetical protein
MKVKKKEKIKNNKRKKYTFAKRWTYLLKIPPTGFGGIRS